MNADEAYKDAGDGNGDDDADNDADPVDLPVLEHGYREVPMGWQELADIIGSGELGRLTRNVSQQRRYETFKRTLRRRWKSLYDYILVDKFGFESEVDIDTGLLRATPPPTRASPRCDDDDDDHHHPAANDNKNRRAAAATHEVRLVQNDFPYCTAEGVEHWVLWKLGKTAPSTGTTGTAGEKEEAPCEITSEDVESAQAELRRRLGDVEDFLHWVNPPHLKTVPELDHVHILCLRRRRDDANVAAVVEDNDDDERYRTAVEALYSPLHQSTSVGAIRDATSRRTHTVDEMRAYLERIGLDVAEACPPCLHITGTKGKGSTAAMCESILRQHYGLSTGLFTSPHLLDIRERIRIMGKPVSSTVFGRVYWHLRNKLERHSNSSADGNNDDLPAIPGYFRMLTLMALYIFAHHQDPAVDVMVVEVGMGGRYDATNVVTTPKVCGIALIDYDHVEILGDTLEKIAQEKVGIYTGREQAGEFCYVLDTNAPAPVRVIADSVEELGGRVQLVGRQHRPLVPLGANLGLSGRHQHDNVELAVAMCRAAVTQFPQLEQRSRYPSIQHGTIELDDASLLDSLSTVSWPGRCQLVKTGRLALFLDGAHTPQSLIAGLESFQQQHSANQPKALIVTCSHERNPIELLAILCTTEFSIVVFARPDSERPSAVTKPSAETMLTASAVPYKPELQVKGEGSAVTWHDSLATVWKHLVLSTNTKSSLSPGGGGQTVLSSISANDALETVRQWSNRSGAYVSVLVTGSLYLVGSVLDAVGWSEESASGSVRIV